MTSNPLYNFLLVVAIILSVAFIGLIYVTGKGDAMSGSGSIRTTFKGKASIEDQISKLTYVMAAVFIGLMIALDFIANRSFR